MHDYYVYIMTNKTNTTLYTGVTNNLQRRVFEHKNGNGGEFTKRYQINKFVFYEIGGDIKAVIQREKQIKAGSRRDKLELINKFDPEWKDLSMELFE
jgi:putative endonuclease